MEAPTAVAVCGSMTKLYSFEKFFIISMVSLSLIFLALKSFFMTATCFLFNKKENYDILENKINDVKSYILGKIS